jgi:hypothetical protein
MAIEARRGCGYRKVGGLYLVCDPSGFSCDRLPFNLLICPTCGQGIKFSRGWTWVFPYDLFKGDHKNCHCPEECPVCHPIKMGRRAGLMWVGKAYYTPGTFIQEAGKLGVSKRIHSVPRGFKPGETWVLLAHQTAGSVFTEETLFKTEPCPAIFYAFIPQRIEKIVTETQHYNKEEMKKLENRGITPIIVPDNDKDHQ